MSEGKTPDYLAAMDGEGGETSSGETPEWLLGSGLDTDMTGDIRPGAGGSSRFWMKRDTERTIIFVTEGDRSPVVYEHQFQMGGDWKNWVSCLEPIGLPCQLCKWANDNDNQFSRYKGQFFGIIDTTEYKGRDEKVYKNQKRMLVAKKATTELIKRKYLTQLEAERGLHGAMFKVFRGSDSKTPSVGNDYEYIKHIDLATEFPDIVEFDWRMVLAPNADLMKTIYGRLRSDKEIAGGGEGESKTPEGTESKVKF